MIVSGTNFTANSADVFGGAQFVEVAFVVVLTEAEITTIDDVSLPPLDHALTLVVWVIRREHRRRVRHHT